MCFKLMDADGSGAIDAEELGAAFRLLGIQCAGLAGCAAAVAGHVVSRPRARK